MPLAEDGFGLLSVAEDLQGQGIGEQIMDLVHGEVRDSASLSAARLVTSMPTTNHEFVAFYQKLG